LLSVEGPIIALISGPQIGLVCFVLLFGAAIAGMAIAASEPKAGPMRTAANLVGRCTIIMAVLAALMLTLLTISLKSSFDLADQEVRHFSAQLIDLDRTLRRAGSEGAAVRETLFRYTTRTMKDFWPKSHPNLRPEDATSTTLHQQLEDQIGGLRDADAELRADIRRDLHDAQALRFNIESRIGGTLSPWLVGFLLFWLALTFTGLGMSAPRSPIAITTLLLFAVAISGAVFLASEYDYPFDGVIIISTDPLETALFSMTE
jgi:hypothetical protein